MERLVTLSKIITALGPIKGEKSLQKIIYLVEQYGERLNYSFRWNHFGPISFDLMRDIQEMQLLGLISISQDEGIPVYHGPSNFSHLTSFWNQQLNKSTLPESTNQVITKLHSMGDQLHDPLFLEVLASLDFLQRYNMTHQYTIEQDRCPEQLIQTAQQSLNDLQVLI